MKKQRIELKDCGVTFLEDEHRYFLGETELSGITNAISTQLGLANAYDNIPAAVLEKATQRGTEIHQSIQRFNSEWVNDGSPQVQSYIKLCKDNNIVAEANEYLVSDLKHYASSIDLVARVNENTFDLYDIKSWAAPNNDNLMKARYQLSIYAFFFTLANPEAKIRNLAIIHLRETEKDHISEIIPVQRIPSDICEELLQTYIEGKLFNNPYDVPLDIRGQESLIRSLLETKANVEEQLNQIKSGIMKRMEALDIRSWQTDTMKITRKLASTRSSFDFATFKLAYPDLNYDDYMRTSRVSPSLVITV